MNYFYDITTRQFTDASGSLRPLRPLRFMRQEDRVMAIRIQDNGETWTANGTAAITFGIKATPGETADTLAIILPAGFTLSAGVYTGTLALNGDDLSDLLGTELSLNLHAQLVIDDDDGTHKSDVIPVVMGNDIIRGDEGSPSTLPDPDSYIRARAVVYDAAQTLTSPQKVQARANIGTVIGTDVQAYDADLAAIAGLTSAADKGIQFTGAGTAATYDLTAAGKALLDDASATAQRATLGLGTSATYAATSAATNGTVVLRDNAGGVFFSNTADGTVGLTSTSTGTGTVSVYGVSANGTGVIGASTIDTGVSGSSTSGVGTQGSSGNGTAGYFSSDSGTGAYINSTSGTYHALFGGGGADNRSFIARVKGALGWFRGAFTGQAQAADTLTANRTYTLPDASGTVVLGGGTASGTNTGDQTSIVGITGNISQFNTALTDGDFATLAGTETLTNKTLTSPTLTTPVLGAPSSGNLTNCSSIPAAQLTGDVAVARIATALTAPGAIGGTTAAAGAFSTVTTPSIKPSADGATAVRVFKADGATAALTLDTTNTRLGIGATPSYPLHINVGGSNPIGFGRNASFITYGAISMNNTMSDTGMVGFFGGGGSDGTFYLNAVASIVLRPGGSGSNVKFRATTSGLILGGTGDASTVATRLLEVNGSAYISGDLQLDKTITAVATTGAQTINKSSGRVNFAAAATSLVVTNSLCTANSIIHCTIATNDTTATGMRVVAAAGSFTIHMLTAPTAETAVNFLLTN